MNINGKGFVGNKLDINRIRTLVFGADLVFRLSYGVLADSEPFDEDLTVGVSLEHLIIVLTGYAEREAFHASIGGGLDDLQVANHMVVNETYTGFVLDFYHFTVVDDCEVMIGIILDVISRCLLLIEEVTSVSEVLKLVQTGLIFNHLSV